MERATGGNLFISKLSEKSGRVNIRTRTLMKGRKVQKNTSERSSTKPHFELLLGFVRVRVMLGLFK